MVIVNQDRTLVVNFNSINCICTNDNEEEDGNCIFANMNDHSQCKLGEYGSDKRAVEVLADIVKRYKATEAFKTVASRVDDDAGVIAIEKGFVYEMPEE